MQCTHFVPDELERQKGLREPVTLQGHTDFAAEVLGLQERQRLLHHVEGEAREGLAFWRGLLSHLGRRRWVLGVWAAEAVLVVALISASADEIWNDCPMEVGPLLACRHCFGGVLAAWELVLGVLWAFHLQLSVLLVSRGFSFCARRAGQPEKNTGVPQAASQLFVGLSGALALTLVTGCVLLAASRGCLGGHDFEERSPLARPPRSALMQYTATATVIVGPLLLCAGRLSL
mmetsp:Transcript_105724/g.268646  ORF Transcript_105724/g.268646 Transcript_105724/m.268646 type:complete len:232 (+) Transcript_105724:188-883(+)